jgi:hypothetical protein
MSHYYLNMDAHGKTKTGIKINTQLHYEYIAREGRYERMRDREEDIVYKASGNIPDWADNTDDFWKQAEANRPKPNGRAYREIKIGLQEEFTLEENIQLIEEFLKSNGIKDHHAYSYAIHDKAAAFDKQHRNIHVHIMFNEKIQEKDRLLGPDKYFKMYKSDHEGNPTQGYRTSRLYSKEETLEQMRKQWASMCNAKFKEKGLDITVTEKSLADQREELLKDGKTEEAELLNRTPSPHLGKVYRNPKTMEHIQERIQQFDNETDKPETSEELDPKTMDNKEQMVVRFALDAVVRKAARELQQERAKLYEQIEENAMQEEAEAMRKDPAVITVSDLQEWLTDKLHVGHDNQAKQLQEYRKIRAVIMDGPAIERKVLETIFKGKYEYNRKAYAKAAKELIDTKKMEKELLAMHDPTKDTDLAMLYIKEDRLEEERTRIGRELGMMRTARNGKFKGEAAKLTQAMIKESEANKKLAGKAYAQMKKAKEQTAIYQEAYDKIKGLDPGKVLFDKNLPKQLERWHKIDGQHPIGKLKMYVLQGEIYAELPPTLTNDDTRFYAVKLGDDVDRGKVPLYVIQKGPDSKLTGILSTDKTAKIYKTRKDYNKAYHTVSQQQKFTPIKIEQARQMQSIEKRLAKLADEIVGPEKEAVLRGNWTEKPYEYPKDEVERAEEDMYKGWNL